MLQRNSRSEDGVEHEACDARRAETDVVANFCLNTFIDAFFVGLQVSDENASHTAGEAHVVLVLSVVG